MHYLIVACGPEYMSYTTTAPDGGLGPDFDIKHPTFQRLQRKLARDSEVPIGLRKASRALRHKNVPAMGDALVNLAGNIRDYMASLRKRAKSLEKALGTLSIWCGCCALVPERN